MGLQPKVTGLAQPSFSAQVHCRKPAFLPPACRETSRQADRAVLELLSRFGAEVRAETGGVFVRKAALHGISIDAGAIPDLIPAVAVVAAYAEGKTNITNAARLRLKESDRLHTVAETIKSLGGQAKELPDGLVIAGNPPPRGRNRRFLRRSPDCDARRCSRWRVSGSP